MGPPIDEPRAKGRSAESRRDAPSRSDHAFRHTTPFLKRSRVAAGDTGHKGHMPSVIRSRLQVRTAVTSSTDATI